MTPNYSSGSPPDEDVKEISTWCCRNSLLINPDKTKLLYVGVSLLMGTLPATLLRATILETEIKLKPVTVAKDLGVHMLLFNFVFGLNFFKPVHFFFKPV